MLIKKVVKKGSSKYILMPNDILEMLNLCLGDEVAINVENGKIVITPITKEINKMG
jgi:antitoxin component of MazEF toxin-antitoxin module